MRTKTRTARDIKPGMVIRTRGVDAFDLDLEVFRQVAKVDKIGHYSSAFITFTDGSRAHVGYCREFEVARSKSARNSAKTRAAAIPSLALAGALNVLGGYAIAGLR